MEFKTDLSQMNNGEKAALGGGVLAIVGAFLPWASALGVTVSGMDGDGVITLVLGILTVAAVLAQEGGKKARGAVGALGVLVILIALVAFGNMGAMVSPSIGLYLTLLAGAAIVAGAGLGFTDQEAQEEVAAEPAD